MKYKIVGIFTFLIFCQSLKALNVPIIFVHGNKQEGDAEAGLKTWNPSNYVTAMRKILNEHYNGYIAGSPFNCDENTDL